MAVTTLSMVWTEREGDIPGTLDNEGDWEACVATSYKMGLLHGGVAMSAPYTQRGREDIEIYGAAADRDQNLDQSDVMSLRVHGVKLRTPTVLNTLAAITRVGVGMCLTGRGSPNSIVAGTTFLHEIFVVGVTASQVLVFDPLAPYGSAPVLTPATKIATWAFPLTATNAREVNAGEFSGGTIGTNMPVIENLKGYPPGTVIQFVAGKEYQFFAYDNAGNRTSLAAKYPSPTNAPTEALVDLTGDGPAHFIPRIYIPGPGYKNNLYLPVGYAAATFPEQADEEAIAKAVAARDEQWKAKISASHHP